MVNKILRSILKWFVIYFACILSIQLCNPFIVDAAKYIQVFNAELIFNQVIWLIICLLLGIYCFVNRIISFNIALLVLAVYCTFRLYEGVHPGWIFMKLRSIYYLDILVLVLFLSSFIDSIRELLHIITWKYKHMMEQNKNINKKEPQSIYSENSNPTQADDKFGFYDEVVLFLEKLEEQKKFYQDNALIVGLEGEWGSGKSFFISMIGCAISECNKSSQFKLVKFSSWNYRNSNQLTIELLSTISEAIGVKEVTKAIDKYIKVFEGTSFQWLAGLTRIFCGGDKTTQEYFNDVNEKLKYHNQTLIIAVDDIDRLVKEEVLEVLKLVRNTANFRNIVYVVAYDRAYVEETLKEYGINNSGKYLEKIFNVPFLLPEKSIEQKKALYKEILQKNIFFNKTDKTDSGIVAFVEEFGEYLSIRNVKKLAKQLLINTPFIRKDGLTFELDIYDTLILYYLSIKYKKIYEKLKELSYGIKKLDIYKKELIYCTGGYVFINILNDDNKKSDIEYFTKYKIAPIVGDKNAVIVSKFMQGLLGRSDRKYDKTAYCMSNLDVYPIFFSKKIPEDYVKTKDFIDESKKSSFPERLIEWNKPNGRTMLGWVISCLRYEDYNDDEFISMFKTVISEVTIKESWTIYASNPPTDKTIKIIPGIDCRYNWKSEGYKSTVRKVIEVIEYDNTFSQRFALLVQSDTFKHIYETDYDNYISICEKYLDVYLSQNNSFDSFNYDFWGMLGFLYEYTHEDEIVIGMQEKCKSHILKNIRSFADNWGNNKDNDYLSCVFSTNLVAIKHNFKGGWKKYFFEFIEANKDKISDEIISLFHNYNSDLPE